MKITYLYHDCFLIETERCFILTDYWEGVPINPLTLMNSDKPCYVLISHHHKDHFSPRIYSWSTRFRDIHYLISNDVKIRCKHFFNPNSKYLGPNRTSPDKVNVLRPGEVYKDNIISVYAFGSTDIGNSYVIETEGKRLFFAGDLNVWVWRDESSGEEVDDMLRRFYAILKSIYASFREFNVAFFPVDPRMGKDLTEGAELFCQMFSTKVLIPMHFELWKDKGPREKFIEEISRARAILEKVPGLEYIPLSNPLESVTID